MKLPCTLLAVLLLAPSAALQAAEPPAPSFVEMVVSVMTAILTTALRRSS